MRIAIGTRKGLWLAREVQGSWEVTQPLSVTAEFSSVAFAPRISGPARILAGARSWFWGPSVMTSDDEGLTWSDPEYRAIAFPEGDDAILERVWTLKADPRDANVVWAGCEPHSLWRSEDGGTTFALNEGLWNHPHRPQWEPGAGGPAIHTVVPRPDGSMVIAMSTGGVYRSTDGEQWDAVNRGIRAEFQPNEYPEFGQCVHRIAVDAVEPARIYAQNHGGVYRTDDSGDTWKLISQGLPADFGFMVLAHPTVAKIAWTIPIDADTMFPANGRLRLYRTEDAGGSWAEVGRGLPDDCFASVLRDAADVMPFGDDAAVAFGTRNGSVYASLDGGDSFTEVVSRLPDILSVRISV